MNQDVPKVHLEITVPRLTLTDKDSSSVSATDTDQNVDHPAQDIDNKHTTATERIEVQLVAPGTRKHPDSPQGNDSEQLMDARLTPLMAHAKRSGTFRAGDIPARGEMLSLQVLRQCMTGNRSRSGNTDQHERFQLSDEIAFSVKFLPIDEAHEIAQSSDLQTASNRIVIFVDEEGKPCSYSIDGAES